MNRIDRARAFVPGLLVAFGVIGIAMLAAMAQRSAFDAVVVDALVAAIVVGMLVRTLRLVPRGSEPGIDFAARPVLEVAIVLLGASVNLRLLVQAGPTLVVGIIVLVAVAVAAGYAIGRAVGLSRTHAMLVAAGNAICGNSAIVALAPVIDAQREEVASAIAFTAILGVVVVVGLPHLLVPLGLTEYQYGVLAGLSVYAVPQVLAAAFPVSALAGQVGTLVKLVRVLLLGPLVLLLGAVHHKRKPGETLAVARAMPWFIVGFMGLATLRSLGAISEHVVSQLKHASSWLTLLSMAGLGLGVDLRDIARVGPKVVLAASASLAVLLGLSLALLSIL